MSHPTGYVYVVTRGYVEDGDFIAFETIEAAKAYAEAGNYEVLEPIEYVPTPERHKVVDLD